MIKGHLDQQRANLRSTKPKPIDNNQATTASDVQWQEEEEEDAIHVATDPPASKTQYLYAKCETTTGKVFTDQTGRFLVTSASGNIDMLALYEYNSNYIHVEPMKNKSGPEILAAY